MLNGEAGLILAFFCVALGPGELVKDGYFTLFESVGALEVWFVSGGGSVRDGTDERGPRSWIRRWIAGV
jgi:hypothetical protein